MEIYINWLFDRIKRHAQAIERETLRRFQHNEDFISRESRENTQEAEITMQMFARTVTLRSWERRPNLSFDKQEDKVLFKSDFPTQVS